MNVPEAWQITTGSPNVVVAVIDDGVDFSHPDLAGRAWVNPGETPGDGIDNDANGHIDDINGWDFCNDDATLHDAGDYHGTHVAGSIAASGNGTGIAGVAPSVKIMALKFISDDPSCSTDFQAVQAIEYAHAKGARIVNASWGGYDYSSTIYAAIDNVSDTLFVAAAGNDNIDNDGPDSVYPASFDLSNILAVASAHNEGFLSDATNYGIRSVDIAAPGEDILSSVPDDDPGDLWQYFSGTSMAAANTSGVAALVASARPALLAAGGETMKQHLVRTARALPSVLGWIAVPRLIDARAAVVTRPDVRRLSGTDRYATAAAISAATFTPHVPYLFIATGNGLSRMLSPERRWPPKRGRRSCWCRSRRFPARPWRRSSASSRTTSTCWEGPGSSPRPCATSSRPTTIRPAVDRTASAGADRYATAAAISRAAFDPGGPTAFIATGTTFPDALAGAPASAQLGGPLLLVTKTGIPSATATELSRLRPARIVILGGTAVVSNASGDPARQLQRDGHSHVRRRPLRHRGKGRPGRVSVSGHRVRRQRPGIPRCVGRRPIGRRLRGTAAARLGYERAEPDGPAASAAQAGPNLRARWPVGRLELGDHQDQRPVPVR